MGETTNSGYVVNDCHGFLKPSECKLSCISSTHEGTPSIQCNKNGGEFILSGCKEKEQKKPKCKLNKLNLDKGYKVVKCDGRVEAAQCDVVCNPLTHSGTAHVQCSTDGSDFVVSGCSENRCYAPEGD